MMSTMDLSADRYAGSSDLQVRTRNHGVRLAAARNNCGSRLAGRAQQGTVRASVECGEHPAQRLADARGLSTLPAVIPVGGRTG